MPLNLFYDTLQSEVARIDAASTSKRHERVIEGFTNQDSPKAVINSKEFQIFNSNDYLGLRHHKQLKDAEHQASKQFGTGPGAVRFISGTLSVNVELEKRLAAFHGRQAAMVFSSAFATNMAVLFSLIAPQAKDSKLNGKVLVISDELNHRSIIDGIRIANLPKEQRAIFKHLDPSDLARLLEVNSGMFDRVIVITDGVFSMLGEYQQLKEIRQITNKFDNQYPQGILLVVDDAHGVGAAGATGRGTEEVTQSQADILIGTLGKAFGTDGGYVVADQVVIDYLRESAGTYIYSNSITPGTAGAALKALTLIDQPDGKKLLEKLNHNIAYFKKEATEADIEFATDSSHPIQPVLIGSPQKTAQLSSYLFDNQIIVTKINYPVVPLGRDEIRIQISAAHTTSDIDNLITHLVAGIKQL